MQKDPQDLSINVNVRRLVSFARDAGLSDDQVQKLLASCVSDEAERAAGRVWDKFEHAARMTGVYLNQPF